mgnify:CR=1 FL=1|jgi:hypothetical protein
MARTCATEGCSNELPPQKGPHRPRKYCTTCRPPAKRPNPRVIELPAAEEALPGGRAASMTDAYREKLAAVGRLETPEGAHVMHLVRLMESGVEGMTASGAASLSRELRAAMAEAMKDAGSATDSLDELAKRRQAKAGGA